MSVDGVKKREQNLVILTNNLFRSKNENRRPKRSAAGKSTKRKRILYEIEQMTGLCGLFG